MLKSHGILFIEYDKRTSHLTLYTPTRRALAHKQYVLVCTMQNIYIYKISISFG